jgi:hypothetical protein
MAAPRFARLVARKPRGLTLTMSQEIFFDRNKGRIIRGHADATDTHLLQFCTTAGMDLPLKLLVEKRLLSEDEVMDQIFADVRVEVANARAQHPTNEFMHTALTEEVGEAAQAVIDTARGLDTADHCLLEFTQVMAVVTRLIMEGSKEWPFKGLLSGSHMVPYAKQPLPKKKAVKVTEVKKVYADG